MHTVERLFKSFVPEHYQLTLDLSEAHKRKFSGTVAIKGIAKTDGRIQLHAKDLKIKQVRVADKRAKSQLEGDTLTIESAGIAYDDTVNVSVDFTGRITDSMHGLYPCYFEHNGEKKELFATQFESHHAREVFPCVDEPEAKATFDLTVYTRGEHNVLSNMPGLEKLEHMDYELIEHQFQTTPRMSTYLLAFVVGDMQKKSAQTKDGVDVSVWATHAQPADSLDFALDVAVRSIEFFNDYFGTPYPLPKADHVALPDFSSGAMENWGLITYREICMLADSHTSVSTRQYVATVIAHETSHQWFGNLVTMKWWDDLWLNESFATLMEYVCVDALFPAWDIWMTFATSETLSALRRDYLPGVQSVKTAVNHPDEINTLFDPSIVYAKGARLLAMLRDYVGDDAFRKGLSQYFQDHPYKNTTGNDLWQALSTASSHDIAAFMTPWLEQPGLPVVHVTPHDEEQIELTQERFLIGGQAKETGQIWPIPLKSNQENPEDPLILDTVQRFIPNVADLQINCGGRGHFVSHYNDANLLNARIKAVQDGHQENPADRLTLLHDLSLLARAGLSKTHDLFEVTRAYQRETSEPVWDIVSLVVSDLKRFLEIDDVSESAFKKTMIELAQPSYERLGWEDRDGEPETDTKLRATIIGLLTYAEEPSIIQRGLDDFRAATDLNMLPGELRSIVFVIATKHGTPEDVERLIETHGKTNSSELQTDIAIGLTATRDPELVERLLGFLTDESVVRLQDVDRWFVYLIRNRYAREKAWQWLLTRWQWIIDTFASDKSYDNFVRYSASAFSTREWLEQYKAFFWEMRDQPALTRAIELGVNDITGRVEWLERDQTDFLDYLKKL